MEKIVSKKSKDSFLFSNPGNKIQAVMKKVFDSEKGREVVKKTGEIDIYEYIQSSASQTDFAQLRAAYLKTGVIPQVDPTLVHGQESLHANNIHELFQAVEGAKEQFNSLPDEFKAIFGDADKFVEALTKGNAQSMIISGLTKKEEVLPEENGSKEGE